MLGRMVHRVAYRCGVLPVAIAAEVAYNGAQDALYGVLLGGKR